MLCVIGVSATTYTHKVLTYPLNNYNSSGLNDWTFFGTSPIDVAYGANYIAINASSTDLNSGSGWRHNFNWTTRYPITLSWQQEDSVWQVGNTIINFKMSSLINNISIFGSDGYCMAEVETDLQNQPPIYYWFNYKYDNPTYTNGAYQYSTSAPVGFQNFSITITPNNDNVTKPSIAWYRNGALIANATMTSGACDNVDNLYVMFGMANSQPQTTFIKNIVIDGYAVNVAPSSNGDCTGIVCADACVDSNYLGINGLCLNTIIGHICTYDPLLCSNGCLNGACVNPSCPYQPNPPFAFPILWYEPFNYNSHTITSNGWTGYPWVIGQNWLNTCNELYAPTATSTNSLTYTFTSAYHQPITFTWDMWGSSDNNDGTYMAGVSFNVSNPYNVTYFGGTQATILHLLDSTGADAINLQFAWDGNIYNTNQTSSGQVVGNWNGAGVYSYKLVIHPDNQTFDFYFTNETSNPFSDYWVGCIDCQFATATNNIKGVEFEPLPWLPPMPPNANWGLWLDNLKLVDTNGLASLTQDNYCNFAGCIFYDPFSYTDSTYNHGWFLFSTSPTDGYIQFENNTFGYYFQHDFDTFRSSDADGIVTFQFRAVFPAPASESMVDIVNFAVDGAFNIEFTKNTIIDIDSMNSLGTYNYGTWNTYTIVLDLVQNTYDLYLDHNKIVAGQPIPITAQVNRLGFWVNDPASIYIDQVVVAEGLGLLNWVTSDTGVPAEHLKNCWSPKNGSFDWTCCNAQERISKSGLCPLRVTAFYFLGGITTFVLTYFLYFIILIIIVVVAIPFLVPKRN